MTVDDVSDHVKPQSETGAVFASGFVPFEKFVENIAAIFFADALAAVFNGYGGKLFILRDADGHGAADVHKLKGIVQKIDKHTGDGVFIAKAQTGFMRLVEHDINVFFFHLFFI